MGYSSCISQWDEETNEFCHVTWKDIDWLKSLSKRMANERFLCISPWHEKANVNSNVRMMERHWLVEKFMNNHHAHCHTKG